MLLLPTPVNPTALRSFWVLLSMSIGVSTAPIVPLVGVSGGGRVWVAAAVTVGLALLGLVIPRVAWSAYRAWNWVARRLAGVLTRYVTVVCFMTVMWPLSRSTSPQRFEGAPTGASTWKDRGAQPPDRYASLHHEVMASPTGPWLRPLWSWIRSSGRTRAAALLPFLLLLHVLDVGGSQRQSADHHIYTLY